MEPLEIAVLILGTLLALAAVMLWTVSVAGRRAVAEADRLRSRVEVKHQALEIEIVRVDTLRAQMAELREWREMLTAICRMTGIAVPEEPVTSHVSADTSTAWARGTLYDVPTSAPSRIKVPSTTTEAEAPAA